MDIESLLLTWTISPSRGQKYQSASLSPEIRELQYFKSLVFYIAQSNFNKIVFCENSDYSFSNDRINNLKYLSELYKKEVELLHFRWDFERTNRLWYWYWEWECLDYAIDNSKILKDAKTFYKLTGRYIIWNINDILNIHKDSKNLFIRDIPSYFTMNTAFFKMEVNLYKKYFYNAKKFVNHLKNENFESAFYKIVYDKNLFYCTQKLKILPCRVNYEDDNFPLSIHKYNVIKRPKQWYDYVWIKFGFYKLSSSDKLFYKLISPLTRKKV